MNLQIPEVLKIPGSLATLGSLKIPVDPGILVALYRKIPENLWVAETQPSQRQLKLPKPRDVAAAVYGPVDSQWV